MTLTEKEIIEKNEENKHPVKIKQKKEKKIKSPVDPKNKFSYKFKKWFFGVGKEFKRITWVGKRSVFQDFITIIVILTIICVIFLALDTIYLEITK